MNPLPSIASSNIADLFNHPLSRHRFTTTTLIGDNLPTPLTTSVDTPTVVALATAATTLVPSTATVDSLATAFTSDLVLVPTIIHPNLALAPTLPIALDTGAS